MTTASRRLAAAATDAACRTPAGAVVRAGRHVLFRARLDYPDEMTVNGESALRRRALELAPGGEIHVADVGCVRQGHQ